MSKKAKDIVRDASLVLKEAGVEEPGVEAMAIVLELAGLEAAEYYAFNPDFSDDLARAVMDAAERRAVHEPLQYITGRVEFMDMSLRVGPGVLVPRPETELLVDEFIKRFPDPGAELKIIDLCTGSGCIALALAIHYPEARITATDSSLDAIKYARINARELGLDNVDFLQGSLYDSVPGDGYDVIISNPPYIPSAEIDGLMPEVSKYEPRSALDGGADGLDFYRQIVEGAPQVLKKGGLLFFELGYGQRQDVEAVAKARAFTRVTVIEDAAGHERVLVLILGG